MVTRARVRRAVLWAGVAIGGAAAAMYILGLLVTIRYNSPERVVLIGRGCLSVNQPGFLPGVFGSGPMGWQFQAGPAGWPAVLPRWHQRDDGHERIVLPWWVPLSLGLICGYFLLPKTSPPGRCPACGFDIRSAPEAPGKPGRVRCPECGKLSRRP